MPKLIYIANASLNGYTTDAQGKFDWTEPDEEVHQFINDLVRDVGTHLYGRRMYETMIVWETDPSLINGSAVTRDFAEIWQQAEKIVYSTTLPAIQTTRTRLERTFDPIAVRDLVASSTRDLMIGGPGLASHAFRADLVDECHIMLVPIVVAAGTKCLPDDVSLELELISERRFPNGVVHLHYRRKHRL
ncbi:MAG: dihydrofolate reductase family protein [Gemmatimonadaceae bacterium]